MSDENESTIMTILSGLVSQLPCCGCCESDEGYIEAVFGAIETAWPELSDEERQTLRGRIKMDHWYAKQAVARVFDGIETGP